MLQSCTALSEIGSLSAQVLVSCGFIFFCRRGRRWGKLSVKRGLTALAVRYVAKEVEVMVEKVCQPLIGGVNLTAVRAYIAE